MQLLDISFYLQVKNKPNGGTIFPLFVLGAGAVTKNKILFTII
jgi:hypothetical protein